MIGIIRFPGTNCDHDVHSWVQHKGYQAEFLDSLNQFEIKNYEAIILPGGFSYGDYLRTGALAAKTPIMTSVSSFAKTGKPVLGICNGFQILCEAGLLPGVLVRNKGIRFIDDWVDLSVAANDVWWTKNFKNKKQIKIPIAHGDGRYYNSDDEIKRLQDKGQIWLTYEKNPNGSLANIAGIVNEQKNVAGLMPHPERALFDWMGSVDGQVFL